MEQVDEQAVHDCFEKALLRHQSLRSKADSAKKSARTTADNADVRDLCHLLLKHQGKGKSLIQIAREFTKENAGNDAKAKSLLRQARRYSHLWRRADN
jgi:hypothetical protein